MRLLDPVNPIAADDDEKQCRCTCTTTCYCTPPSGYDGSAVWQGNTLPTYLNDGFSVAYA